MNIYKPDIFASLADKITDEAPSLKRIRKSVDRTLKWLDEALSHVKVCQIYQSFRDPSLNLDYVIKQEGIQVFGVVTGHDNQEERIRSAQETAKRNVAGTNHVNFNLHKQISIVNLDPSILIGFVLNGNYLGNTSKESINILKSSIDHLPLNKPRLVYGLGTPGMKNILFPY